MKKATQSNTTTIRSGARAGTLITTAINESEPAGDTAAEHWLATFAPDAVKAHGYRYESGAIRACVEQMRADADALASIADRLEREGR